MVIGGVELRQSIRSLQLTEIAICVHASLRSFGYVEGGASTIVRAFLDEGCTVLAPTFTPEFQSVPPADRQYARNGSDYQHHAWWVR